MAQETQTGAMYQRRGVRWGGRWEAGSKGKRYVYIYGWFMLRFDTKQNSLKQLSFKNQLKRKKINNKRIIKIFFQLPKKKKILLWVAISLFTSSSWPNEQTLVSLVSPALASGFFSTGLPGKAQNIEHSPSQKKKKKKRKKIGKYATLGNSYYKFWNFFLSFFHIRPLYLWNKVSTSYLHDETLPMRSLLGKLTDNITIISLSKCIHILTYSN